MLWITLRQAEQYPELSAFGVQQWTLRCSDGERIYLLKSDNPIDGATNTRSYTDRNLHFLAADGNVIHSSYAFVPKPWAKKASGVGTWPETNASCWRTGATTTKAPASPALSAST